MEHDSAQVIALSADGLSIRKIARRLHMSTNTVSRILRAAGRAPEMPVADMSPLEGKPFWAPDALEEMNSAMLAALRQHHVPSTGEIAVGRACVLRVSRPATCVLPGGQDADYTMAA